jgi:trigger factor
MTEPETVENEDSILNLQVTESNAEGEAVENGVNKAISLVVKHFAEDVRKELMGKKKDDTFSMQLSKSIEESQRERVAGELGLNKNNEEDLNKYFTASITKIGAVEQSELNEEFYNSVYPDRGIVTEDDFRSAVKEEIQRYLDSQATNQVHDQLYHHLIDHTQLDFPENFLKRWLQMGGEKAKTAEEAESEYPTFVNQLKWSLISSKLISENNITVESDEIKQQAVNQIMSYMGGYGTSDLSWLDEYANRMLQDKKFVEQTYVQLQTSKLFTLLEGQVSTTEESISADEFAKKQHHHHH